ncbi:hypothetical protein ACFOZ5_05840 [Marinobacter lacisalsi]|uniref:Uncharacterized protein n=1 Tax=Marinobacter lacisalsi TaxID=475979 RepID=A0ABV8QG89_9GAMM
MSEINEDTLNKIEAEYSKWGEYLNGGLGLLSFSFGLSCLGTPRPDITGSISLVFIIIFSIYGKEHFPEKLKELRKKELSGVDELTLLRIEKRYFGISALFRNFPVYLIGWTFLGLVAIYGVATNSGWL